MPCEDCIQHRQTERWEHHREIHKAEDKALQLQAIEYGRRLDHLNGEHERIKEILATYLTRELFETTQTQLNLRLRQIEDFKNNWTGRAIAIGGFIAILSAIVGGFIARLVK